MIRTLVFTYIVSIQEPYAVNGAPTSQSFALTPFCTLSQQLLLLLLMLVIAQTDHRWLWIFP